MEMVGLDCEHDGDRPSGKQSASLAKVKNAIDRALDLRKCASSDRSRLSRFELLQGRPVKQLGTEDTVTRDILDRDIDKY